MLLCMRKKTQSASCPGIRLAGLESCLGMCVGHIPIPPPQGDWRQALHRQDDTGAWASAQSNGLNAILLGAMRGGWVVKDSQTPLAGRVRGWPHGSIEEAVVGKGGQLSGPRRFRTGVPGWLSP